MTTTLPAAPVAEAPEPPRAPRWRSPATWTWVLIAAVVACYAALGWRRRWIADDGLIVLRTVRQLLAGNGPVFNAGERVEANTSALWTAALSLAGLVPGVALDWAAVLLGLVFSSVGVFLGLDGARRLHRGSGPLVPAGALVVLALPPFRDFATSGLETGLILLWCGGAWWALVRHAVDRPARAWPAALVLGLGYLVRPDLALFSAVGLAALLLLRRPGWRRAVGLLAVAGALPLAYQVFRMGYYGLTTPVTALAKEASIARWDRGWAYFYDLITPYHLWLPVVVLAVAADRALRRDGDRRVAVAVAAPVVSGVLLAVYVIRVGGDFMHGRMLLPALFCLLLPAFLLPVRRFALAAPAVVTAWAVVAATALRVPYGNLQVSASGVVDERAYYSAATGAEHPMEADHVARRVVPERVLAESASTPVIVVFEPGPDGVAWRSYPSTEDRGTIAFIAIGAISAAAPLDVAVRDTVGLTYPVVAHATMVPGTRVGHEKHGVPPWWYVADLGAGTPEGLAARGTLSAADVAAARRVLACPRVREMLDSARAPLTFDRFWRNLVGAVDRTALRYEIVPTEQRGC